MIDVEEEVLTETPLALLDRCDKCSAAAQVRATAEWGELIFCGHHFAQNEAGLIGAGASIYDQRTMISK